MVNHITKSFSRYKGVIVFSGLKYLEIVITALTTFFLAEIIGPREMGKAIPVLLYITYSTYLSLGVNQVIIKNYSEFEKKHKSFDFLNINLQYHLLISLISIGLAVIFIDLEYALLAGAVSAGTMVRSYFMAYFRVVNKIFMLNKNNLIFSVLLLISVFTLVNTWNDYLLYWAITMWISVFIYIFDARKILKVILLKHFFSQIDWIQVRYIINQGIPLAIIGATTTFLLTFDRIIISNTELSLNIKGTYQLADYFGKAFYMIGTTVLFYYYPSLLKRLRNDKSFSRRYLNLLLKTSLLIIPIVFLIFGLIKVIQLYYFKDYDHLEWLVSFNLVLKIIVLISSLLAAIFIALNKEMLFLKTNIPIVFGVVMSIAAIIIFNLKELELISIIILILLIMTLVYQFYTTRKLLKTDSFN